MAKTFPLDNGRATQLLELLTQVQDQKGDYLVALEDAIGAVESWVEATTEPERVIFRRFPHDGAVIALFPDQYNERTGDIMSYMELGQHAETAPDFGDTKPAEPGDYYNLEQELIRQGYTNLRIVKRFGKLGRK
jgi:hypothetical protein